MTDLPNKYRPEVMNVEGELSVVFHPDHEGEWVMVKYADDQAIIAYEKGKKEALVKKNYTIDHPLYFLDDNGKTWVESEAYEQQQATIQQLRTALEEVVNCLNGALDNGKVIGPWGIEASTIAEEALAKKDQND